MEVKAQKIWFFTVSNLIKSDNFSSFKKLDPILSADKNF
jgi:hypothetical protein